MNQFNTVLSPPEVAALNLLPPVIPVPTLSQSMRLLLAALGVAAVLSAGRGEAPASS